MKNCTIAELLGISRHHAGISDNELFWWMARSSMKPLPAIREQLFLRDICTVSNVNHMNNSKIFKEASFTRDWFKKPEKELIQEARQKAIELQKTLDEKYKKCHAQ